MRSIPVHYAFQGDSVATYSARSSPARQGVTNGGIYHLTLHYMKSPPPPLEGGGGNHCTSTSLSSNRMGTFLVLNGPRGLASEEPEVVTDNSKMEHVQIIRLAFIAWTTSWGDT